MSTEPAASGPEAGHTFRFLWDSRGSSKVVGDADYTDAPHFDGVPHQIEVRGWSLVEALRNAAELPFATLVEADVPWRDAVRRHLQAALELSRLNGYVATDHAGGPYHYCDEALVELLHEVIRDGR